MIFPTPELSHMCSIDYNDVYEPAEDTYLLLDALEKDKDFLLSLNPMLAMEIGSGSGCVITFLSKLLSPHQVICLATDINPLAAQATQCTAMRNLVSVDPIITSHANGTRFEGVIDILLCNPPYVPTEALCDPHSPGSLIEAAWAGGPDGRQMINQLIPLVHKLLSPRGAFYMIAMEVNHPLEIATWMQREWDFKTEIVLTRKSPLEMLYVLKFHR